MWQWDQDVHVVDGKEAGVSMQHPLVPVFIDLVGEGDDVAFLEAQLAFIFRVKIIQSPTAGLVHGCCSEERQVDGGERLIQAEG